MVIDAAVLAWLLEGDPAIRWQVLRDLADAAEPEWKAERQRVATDGWGAHLVALRDPEGTWGGGLYTPKWTSTTYTLLLLRRFGLPPVEAAVEGTNLLLDRGLADDGGIDFWRSIPTSETCVTGMVLSIAAAFVPDDDRVADLLDFVLAEQMDDGGWNCQRRPRGATHASFHTTISVLEGLEGVAADLRWRGTGVEAAAVAGREFLLSHRLYRSHRTGEVIDPRMTRFSFPPRWHYDVLRGLDHLQAVDSDRDPRVKDAIDLVRGKERDGRWPLQNPWRGESFFALERGGRPSRWNTLRALRVLRWWARSG